MKKVDGDYVTLDEKEEIILRQEFNFVRSESEWKTKIAFWCQKSLFLVALKKLFEDVKLSDSNFRAMFNLLDFKWLIINDEYQM